jgi:hypothetical protein
MMRHSALASVILVCVLALWGLDACGKRSDLYADRSIPVAASAASVNGAPRFVGRWAASASQCQDPVVLEARSLRAGGSDCDFDKVEASSAGYAAVVECHSTAGLTPGRLTIVTPNQPRISMLTIAGGPFRAPTPLQRCPAG